MEEIKQITLEYGQIAIGYRSEATVLIQLGIAYALTTTLEWPVKNLLIYAAMLLALWDTFKEHGINIAFPHREVIFKTPIQVESGPPS